MFVFSSLISLEHQSVSMMDQPVQAGIDHSGVHHRAMPFMYKELTHHYGAALLIFVSGKLGHAGSSPHSSEQVVLLHIQDAKIRTHEEGEHELLHSLPIPVSAVHWHT